MTEEEAAATAAKAGDEEEADLAEMLELGKKKKKKNKKVSHSSSLTPVGDANDSIVIHCLDALAYCRRGRYFHILDMFF